MTYSIVARNEETGELGAAVASHAFAAGAAVTFAVPGVGAIATQGSPVPGHAERVLAALNEGASTEQALNTLIAEDPGSPLRQTAVIGTHSAAAAFTGALCIPFAGNATESDVSCQGNLLAGDGTWDQMLSAYRDAEGPFEDRLLAALDAGLAAGGDLRGQQAAALIVMGQEPGARPRVDLRVDDHHAPLAELRRLLALSRADERLRSVLDVIMGAPGDPEATLQQLSDIQDIFGAGNREADFWAGFMTENIGGGSQRYLVDPRWQEFRRRLKGLFAG